MPPPYKVLDFDYPGLPEIARTAISQLAPEREWVSSSGARVELYEHKFLPDGNLSPHHGEWILRLRSNDPQDRSRCATIEVRELRGELLPWGEQRTALIFLDARDATWTREKPEPMGDVLKSLYRAVHMEAHRIAGQRAAQAGAQATTPDEDGAGRPKKVREYSEQGKATSGDGPGRRPGRPPYTDQQWQEKFEQVEKVIQKAEAAGISEKTASELMGIPYSTFKYWKKRRLKK